jgi:plasmid stabilization system protein ParE
MAYKIIISALAHDDEYDAYVWYEKSSKGLGEEFLTELETAYEKIALQPKLFSFIDERKILRDYLLPRFPFVIVYRIKDDTVEVITVHHTKKHPGKKYGKDG